MDRTPSGGWGDDFRSDEESLFIRLRSFRAHWRISSMWWCFQLLSSGEMKGSFTILMDPQIGGVTRHSLFLHHNTK